MMKRFEARNRVRNAQNRFGISNVIKNFNVALHWS